MKAHTDQLQVEADAYRTQTDYVIKQLQVLSVSPATKSSSNVVEGFKLPPPRVPYIDESYVPVSGNLFNLLDKTPPKVSQFLTLAKE